MPSLTHIDPLFYPASSERSCSVLFPSSTSLCLSQSHHPSDSRSEVGHGSLSQNLH